MTVNSDKGKSAGQLRNERETRIMDAIRMKVPDRVPIICGFGYFPAKAQGIPCSAAYYDYETWYDAYKKTLPDYPADMIFHQPFTPGKALEILNPRQMRWPGFNAPANHGHQAIEVDFMQADEYDDYLYDASDFNMRLMMSRVSENMEGLKDLPKLSDLTGHMGATALAMAFSAPDTKKAVMTLIEAGEEYRKWTDKQAAFMQLLEDCGFPPYFQGAALPPFDIVSHSMRGMTGTMQDMFRQPDKVLEACDKILEITLARPFGPPSPLGHTRIFMTNTRGSDDFMSTKHFDKFYWPTMKKLIHGLIERDATPCMFFEGNFTSRLEYLLDFPKGSMLVRLDTTDIKRAKEVLKDHLCIQGNVPSSLLQVATVDQVKDYCKDLIDTIGKDGGFILSPRSSTDEANPANLKAMIDFTQEYGVYR